MARPRERGAGQPAAQVRPRGAHPAEERLDLSRPPGHHGAPLAAPAAAARPRTPPACPADEPLDLTRPPPGPPGRRGAAPAAPVAAAARPRTPAAPDAQGRPWRASSAGGALDLPRGPPGPQPDPRGPEPGPTRGRPRPAGAAGAPHEAAPLDASARAAGPPVHRGAPPAATAPAAQPRAPLALTLLEPRPRLAQPPLAGSELTASGGGTACGGCGGQEVRHGCGHWRCVTLTCRPAWFQHMEAKGWLVPRSLERMLDATLVETLDRCEDCRPEGRCLRGEAAARPRFCNFVFKRGTCKFGATCPDCHLHGRGVTHRDCWAYARPQAQCTRDRAPEPPGRGPALVGGAVECAQLPCTPPPEGLEA